MDPNVTLRQIRELIFRREDISAPWVDDDTDQLADLVNDIDVWIVNGGVLPINWQHP